MAINKTKTTESTKNSGSAYNSDRKTGPVCVYKISKIQTHHSTLCSRKQDGTPNKVQWERITKYSDKESGKTDCQKNQEQTSKNTNEGKEVPGGGNEARDNHKTKIRH